MYPKVELFISGEWCGVEGRESLPVLNPATGEAIGSVPVATAADLDRALASVARGFVAWRSVSPFDRCKRLRAAANLLRERVGTIAPILTMEQGKPIAQARTEVLNSADLTDWFAEEGRRAYGWVIPARVDGVHQVAVKEPVGPVAAFSPWNFPMSQAVRKVASALAVGCSMILKGPEEAPASGAALVKAFIDAGIPGDALNLVFGRPEMISRHLIPHDTIRKVSFTGSIAVGRQIAALASQHLKRTTLELGGHAPAVVFRDADLKRALAVLPSQKYRNAGQVCVSPTRFLVHADLYQPFLEGFVSYARSLKVGSGLEEAVEMGPLANARRVTAMEALVEDAVAKGARLHTGGKRMGQRGNFFEPTVLSDLPLNSRIMNEEPFGPVAAITKFSSDEEALAEANRLPHGLAAYAYTTSTVTASRFAAAVQAGMVSINHHGLGLPELPFGGIKESGHGTEGGDEAIEGYLFTKFVTQLA
jgi:succinate-semialdehyde dehydrogenase / glutarate-semialdehyde dehydrogenase